jgi:hypothetical protein
MRTSRQHRPHHARIPRREPSGPAVLGDPQTGTKPHAIGGHDGPQHLTLLTALSLVTLGAIILAAEAPPLALAPMNTLTQRRDQR